MILLDTDHCVFFIRGHREVVRAYEEHIRDEPAISVISVGELYYGAIRSARPENNLQKCQTFIDRLHVLPLEESEMHSFAQIKADLAKQGQPLPDLDLLIAATAMTAGILLITHNTSHFNRIKGLQLEDWCEH